MTNTALPAFEERPRLTSYSPAGGCGCKLGAGSLAKLLSHLATPRGSESREAIWDDAAVVQLTGEAALFTLDFATPIVDGPEDWGAITASNALSDIYAMGGSPVGALAIAGWPSDPQLPIELLAEALKGAQSVFQSAGAALLGGHTIRDASPKLGFAVIGTPANEASLQLSRGRVGDLLILTKPLGTGAACTAIRRGVCPSQLAAEVTSSMRALNAAASSAAVRNGARAATDVTGFGLAVHLHKMALASGVAAEISLDALPTFQGVLDLLPQHETSISSENERYVAPFLDAAAIETPNRILFDPQTSGGMLIAIPVESYPKLASDLRSEDVAAHLIGRLTSGNAGHLSIRR